jgi:hypothetical protein
MGVTGGTGAEKEIEESRFGIGTSALLQEPKRIFSPPRQNWRESLQRYKIATRLILRELCEFENATSIATSLHRYARTAASTDVANGTLAKKFLPPCGKSYSYSYSYSYGSKSNQQGGQ